MVPFPRKTDEREPLAVALNTVEALLLGQVASARKQVEARIKSSVRLSSEERRQVRAIGNGLRFAGDILNELLDRSRGQ